MQMFFIYFGQKMKKNAIRIKDFDSNLDQTETVTNFLTNFDKPSKVLP